MKDQDSATLLYNALVKYAVATPNREITDACEELYYHTKLRLPSRTSEALLHLTAALNVIGCDLRVEVINGHLKFSCTNADEHKRSGRKIVAAMNRIMRLVK